MTHLPFHPVITVLQTAFIFLFISGLPAAAMVQQIWDFRRSLGKVALGVLGPIWLVTYVQTTRLWTEHAVLQQRAAKEADCIGYGEGMFPDRCIGALQSPSVVPDGFMFWTAIALAFGVVGILFVVGPDVKAAVNKWGQTA